MFKLANDENDSILSGVSTPLHSSHKKNSVQESNLKKLSQTYLISQPKGSLTHMIIDK